MKVVSEKRMRLKGARVYLSGPMDFVHDRELEAKFGWRTRVDRFLSKMKVTVLDPWEKPEVRGFHEYGKEKDGDQEKIKRLWTYEQGPAGQEARAWCAARFWETHHIDLRMVDIADFVIAYCPTTIYSVGTVNEIVVARLQYKPVLLVTPHIPITEVERLRKHLKDDERGRRLLADLERKVPIKPNPRAIPSLWYMPLVGGHNFFDGFGFAEFRSQFGWEEGPLDKNEKSEPPDRPLLPFLRDLNRGKKSQKFNIDLRKSEDDDNWLIWELGQKPDSRVKKNSR